MKDSHREKFGFFLIGFGIGVLLTSVLGGCATASSVRKQVAKDLTEIVGYQDCETTCYALRMYLKNKYGISIPDESEPEVAHK